MIEQVLDGALVMLLRRHEERRVAVVGLAVELGLGVDQQRHDVDEAAARRRMERRAAEEVDEVAVGAVLQQLPRRAHLAELTGDKQRRVALHRLQVNVGADDAQRVDGALVVQLGAVVKRRPAALVLKHPTQKQLAL